eukprot:ctg_7103.g468
MRTRRREVSVTSKAFSALRRWRASRTGMGLEPRASARPRM